MSTHWIVVAASPAIGRLVELGRAAGGELAPLVVGPRELADQVATAGLDRVRWLPVADGVPVEAMAGAVATLIAEQQPSLVLAANRSADRALLGAVAGRLGAPALSGAVSVQADGDALVVQRELAGGLSLQTVRATGPVTVVADSPLPAPAAAAVPVEQVDGAALPVTVTAFDPATDAAADLGAARRIVAVGRGLQAEADLAMVEALAKAVDGTVACSRPLAEGLDWLPKDRYIGVSGAKVAPDLYLAAGISGQLQHTVGMRDAGTVVSVNTDKDAPFAEQADYVLVGDLYQVLPALTEELS